MMKHIFRLLLFVAMTVTVAGATGTSPFFGHSPSSLVSIPPMIKVAVDAFGAAPAPDATACANLYESVRQNQETTATPNPDPCPAGVETHYGNVGVLLCQTQLSNAAYTFALSNESAFAHAYNHAPTSGFRYQVPNAHNCDGTNDFSMNVGDPTFDTFLTSSSMFGNTAQKFYPTLHSGVRINAWHDVMRVMGDSAVGASPPYTEYGSGTGTSVGYADQTGSGTFNVGFSWEQAQANFINAVGAAGLSSTLNGLGPPTNDVTGCIPAGGGGRCRDQTYPDLINDVFDINALCSGLTGPYLKYIFNEHPLLHEGSPTTNPGSYATPLTMTVMANTWINIYQHTSDNCSTLKYIDGEFPVGTAGTVASGYQIRLLAAALRWFAINPTTHIPDRVVPGYSSIGGLDTPDEMPTFYENTITPYNPYLQPVPLVWGGTQSFGDGCTGSDTGGMTAFKVLCVGSNAGAVFVIQFPHCYTSLEVDLGPCAAMVNTSSTTENITSGMFTHTDSISTYHYRYAPSGGEMTCVPLFGINDPGASCPAGNSVAVHACTNVTFCTGSTTLTTSTFNGDGSDTLCGQCGAILLANNSAPIAGIIQHIVIIDQENRTPDQLLQDGACTSPDADPTNCIEGFNFSSVGIVGNQQVALSPLDLCSIGSTYHDCQCHNQYDPSSNPSGNCAGTQQPYDLSHNHKNFVHEYNGGKMNGWDGPGIEGNGCAIRHCGLTYTPVNQVEPYIKMAANYATFDNFFQDNQGPSFVSHQFIISGSAGCGTLCTATKNVAGSCCLAHSTPPPTTPTYRGYFALNNAQGGCDAAGSVNVDAMDVYGNEYDSLLYPCFDRTTLPDLLMNAGYTWKYYQNGSGPGLWNAPDAIWHLWNNVNYNTWVDQNPIDFVKDVCTNHTLANVSWITPTPLSSDHGTVTDGSGPDWVASIVNAIGQAGSVTTPASANAITSGGGSGPQTFACDGSFWSSTAIFVIWDDWGAWYDHVAPYMFGVNEKGFRVPAIAISAYTPSGQVDHTFSSFGSILKYTEETFNLPSLGNIDKNAYDLSSVFNMSSPRTFTEITYNPTLRHDRLDSIARKINHGPVDY